MRIWRREGLKVPSRQPKRSRLWLNADSRIRLRPDRHNHVWSWDFVFDRTDDGRTIKLMVVIDEHTRQCLASHVAWRIRAGRRDRCVRGSDGNDLPVSTGPGSQLVYAASWFMGNSSLGTMISGAGGR
jgi:hypothetical protein